MNIPFYSSLEEKKKHFNHEVIENKIDLDDLIQKWTALDDSKSYVFRGVNNAKFKLYNSGQRAWVGQELEKLGKTYEEFIQDEINNAKNFQNGLLIKFFRAFGHTAYDFSILSFLQHYNAPTPLLDFSYNFDCSLFFCIDGLTHNPATDIDNYFSVYAIDTKQPDFISILNHIESQVGSIDQIISTNQKFDINDEPITSKIAELNYSYFEKLKLFYLPGYSGVGAGFSMPSRPDFKLVYNQHNLNIINQEGLFVFNHDPSHPLEDFFSGGFTKFNGTFLLGKIHCWDIHKSFSEYIINYLSSMGITRDFIYPQEEFIALNSFLDFKKDL
ncbi:FRG domain-containing protein [Pedobacter gandavensis]|uniref:FRG domain-containing protein n=1 Tax=Pedobacter gandavensis TaxID=2679963 RepID=A0ABR6EWX7_9SPHI|nr:FRG domain-containing protein [Pedobacter gandavensis]MBB2148933.1 FRG domain-containing protein [Pedobacter gandavensis]